MKQKRITGLFPKGAVENDILMFNIDRPILNQVRRDKNIVYGAQSIKKQLGVLARHTNDYDVYSRNPQISARKLERALDKQAGHNFYYTKPAMHPGTYKVKYVGNDRKPNTKDDLEIADFTKPTRKIGYVVIDNIRYSKLRESLIDKHKSLGDKKFAFRHNKDREDIERIRLAKRLSLRR
jgi:hypothetical protein